VGSCLLPERQWLHRGALWRATATASAIDSPSRIPPSKRPPAFRLRADLRGLLGGWLGIAAAIVIVLLVLLVPDIGPVIKGRFYAVECKSASGRQRVRWLTRSTSVGRIVIRHVGITNYAYVAGPHNSDMATGVTADQRSAVRAQITSSYIASDKRLDGIPEQLNSDSAKRPDVVVFDEKIVFSDTSPAGQNDIAF
jgi:hypothetical protein